MNAPMRRGVCPTLATPMQTGDGLLARLNPVASGLSPDQLVGLCQAAVRHGNGIVEITARGSLQVRGLTAASTQLLAAEVDALGIEVRSGVPVETGPLAGLDPSETADPRLLAARLRDAIADAGLEKWLGPKVSVVVDGGGHSALDLVAADVRLTAGRDGPGLTWRLAVAGDASGATPLGDIDEDAACDAVLTVLKAISILGREGRARDLSWQALREILVEDQRSTLPPNALGIILPLNDGRFAMPAALPFGHIQADHLADFTQRSQALGVTEIRLAPRRALILLCASNAAAVAIREAAGQAGLIVNDSDPRAHIHACPGAPACASGHIPARELAAEIASTIPAGSHLDLHVSGCEKRCAKPGHKGLTLLGFPDGVGLVLESATREPFAVVAKERTAAAIGRVAALVAAEGRTGESRSARLARIGKDNLTKAFEQDTR